MKDITIQNNLETLFGSHVNEKKAPEVKENSFGEILKTSLSEVNQLQKNADRAIQELAAGNEKDIHQTMIALEKAEISFQFMMQVRNKIIAAYQEIMRMQV
jgi:flagellar hook-basal body complex protein FliE